MPIHASLPLRSLLLTFVTIVAVWLPKTLFAEESKKPSLEDLVVLNRVQLFGAPAEVKGGKVKLTFPADGSFAKAFESRSSATRGFLSDPKSFTLVTTKDLVKGMEKNAAFAGVFAGVAASRFQMQDDLTVRFRLRAPTLGRRAQLLLRFDLEGKSRYLQTNFFNEVTLKDGRRPRQVRTARKDCLGHASKWFPRKDEKGVPVEIVFKGNKLSISLEMTAKPGKPGKPGKGKKEKDKPKPEKIEVVSVEGIEAPLNGRLMWSFQGLSFAVADLVVEGKYSKQWAESAISKLKKQGNLVVEKPEVVAKANGKEKKEGGDQRPKNSGKETGEIDLEKPDPEAEEDL